MNTTEKTLTWEAAFRNGVHATCYDSLSTEQKAMFMRPTKRTQDMCMRLLHSFGMCQGIDFMAVEAPLRVKVCEIGLKQIIKVLVYKDCVKGLSLSQLGIKYGISKSKARYIVDTMTANKCAETEALLKKR